MRPTQPRRRTAPNPNPSALVSGGGGTWTSSLLLTMGFAAFLSACGAEPNRGPTVSVRDSAGISIVENRGEVDPDLNAWTVDPTPILSVGTFQGDSLQQLYQVQGAAALPDGGVAIANGGYGQVRIYDAQGQFVRSLGRKGEGPGEFQAPALAGFLPPDTLVVVDNRLRRITLFTLDGEMPRSEGMEEDVGGSVSPWGIFADGSTVVGGGFYFSSSNGEALSTGYSRRLTTYRSVARDGSLVTDFGEFPGSEFFMVVRSQGGGMVMMARLVPFGKFPMAAVGGNRFYFGSGDSWEIREYSPEGALRQLIRWDKPLRPVESEDLSRFIESQVEDAEDPTQAQEIRQQYAEMPSPDFMPAFAGLSVDAMGYLWVERYRGPGEDIPEFDIFDSQGHLAGYAALPEDADVLQIGDDYILALYRDELGIEFVRMFAFHRPEG